jgi:hypothetical protein
MMRGLDNVRRPSKRSCAIGSRATLTSEIVGMSADCSSKIEL